MFDCRGKKTDFLEVIDYNGFQIRKIAVFEESSCDFADWFRQNDPLATDVNDISVKVGETAKSDKVLALLDMGKCGPMSFTSHLDFLTVDYLVEGDEQFI